MGVAAVVTLKNRVGDAAVGGHPVKGGGSCCGRGTCCVGGGCCGWEAQQVVTLKNRTKWGEARFGGTYGVEVGHPARGDFLRLHVISYRRVGQAASGDFLRGGTHCAPKRIL